VDSKLTRKEKFRLWGKFFLKRFERRSCGNQKLCIANFGGRNKVRYKSRKNWFFKKGGFL